LRIAWITTGFLKDENDYGGIAAIHNLAKELSFSPDIELTVFALYYPAGKRDYNFYKAKVFSFRKKGALSLNVSIFDKIKSGIKCIKKFNKENSIKNFDIIHSIWSSESGYIASYLSNKNNIPLVTSICGGELAQIPEINYGSRLKLFQKYFVGQTFKQAKVIVSGSDYIFEKLKLYYNKKIYSKVQKIPFGVNEVLFYPCKNNEEKNLRVKMINIATAFPVKAHNDLFRALKIVIEQYPDTILECYGEDENNTLKKIIIAMGLDKHVKLYGLIDYEKIPLVLNEADIFILSSLYESQNMAVLEAAFCGLPIVSTDTGVSREITRNIVQPGDYIALAEKIIDVIKNPEVKYSNLYERFSLKTSVHNFIKLYDSLINPEPSQK